MTKYKIIKTAYPDREIFSVYNGSGYLIWSFDSLDDAKEHIKELQAIELSNTVLSEETVYETP